MNGHYIEQRTIGSGSSLSWDIAHHLFTRQYVGKVLVVTERPDVILSSVKKQWVKLTRRAQRERASTLDARRIVGLTRLIVHMQEWDFTTDAALDMPQADVFFVHPDGLEDILPQCATMYVACELAPELLMQAAESVSAGGLIVDYTTVTDSLLVVSGTLVS